MFSRKFFLKFQILFLLLSLISSKSQAQVNAYTFSQSILGYTPLTTIQTVAYASPWDDHTVSNAHLALIPFSFNFDGSNYNQCYISPNGFITFGATQPTSTNYLPISTAIAHSGVICALGIDLVSNGSDIVYGVEGVAPNRIFVVQWSNVKRKSDLGGFNFQIRLAETTNVIELSYGLCTPSGATTRTVEVGLRGPNSTFNQGNVLNRIQGSSTVWFGNTINGVANNSSVITNVSAYPDLGLKYKYVPANTCTVPSAFPSNLLIGSTSITNNSFVGNSFTAASPSPTNYLILRSTINTPPTSVNIVNRIYYPTGSSVGIYLVVSNAASTTFTQTGLSPNTTYYYWIVPYNNLCTGAPFYNMTNVLSTNKTTCSAPTVATAATNVGGNGFTANWTAVSGVTNYVIDISTNNSFTALLPSYSNLSVGNVTSLNVIGLQSLTSYYYRVRAIGPSCVVNSNVISLTTTCGYYPIPFLQNFDALSVGAVPPCFTIVDGNTDGTKWQVQNINYSSASRSLYIAKNSTQNMNDWFFVPGLNLTEGVSYRLTFKYNTGNSLAFSENLRVRLGTGSSEVAMTETLLDIQNFNNTIFQTAIVDFSPTSSGVFYIGFYGYSSANQSYIVIDDINVTVSPTCFEPTDVTISDIGTVVATVSWSPPLVTPANGYDYYLSTSSVNPTNLTTPTGSVGLGVNSVVLTSLLPSTYYYVWVRGNCNVSDRSVWTIAESFSTECATPIIATSNSNSRCGYGAVSLSATSSFGSTISWFNSPTGGAVLGVGTSFTTPLISNTTTYYAEAKSFGAIAKVGAVNPVSQGGLTGLQNTSGSVNFYVYSETSLLSVDVFPMVSGETGQLVLRNNSNVTIAVYNFTTSVSGGTTAQVIAINHLLTTGFYNLYFSILPASGVRMNITNASYPYTSSVVDLLSNSVENLYFLGIYNWKFTTQCLSLRTPVVASVNEPPSLSIVSPSVEICENNATSVVSVIGYQAYDDLIWTPNTNISGTFATGFVFNPTVTTTYTLIANQSSGSFCGNILTFTVNVKPAPPSIMIIPSSAALCQGEIQSLNGSAGASEAVSILSENFNSPTNNWTVANTSVGGDVNASQWTLRPNNYNYISGLGWNVTFQSNDNSQFYLANSDAQSAVAGTITRTTLTSPSFSLAGYTSASLSYWNFLRYSDFDTVLIQISVDGGTNWINIRQHFAAQGVQAVPVVHLVNDVVDLNSYLGNINVKIRFNFLSNWGYAWAIDNVLVSGTLAAQLTWSPITDLYTDVNATIPYVSGTPLSVVYSKPNNSITYSATLTGSNGCTNTNFSVLTVSPQTNIGTISPNQLLCSNDSISDIALTGSVGSVIKWESADDVGFTSNVQNIANTSSILSVSQMGTIGTAKFFRALVKSGLCNQLYSGISSVQFQSTTWNGFTWSNGFPDSTKKTIFNGNFYSASDLNACSVLVNSGNIIFNSNHTLKINNELKVVGGSVTFENNSSLLQVNDVVNTGAIRYKRNTMPMKRYDYTYWSTPVSSQTLLSLSPSTLIDKYFYYNPTIDNWVSIPPNNFMQIGKGYIIRAPNTFSTTISSVYNGEFYGIPNNGTYTTPIAVGVGDSNLIGNPYPSALSADLFLSAPENIGVVDATIYLWTHNTPITNGQYTTADYALYNYLGGVGTTSAPNLGVNNTIPEGKIASGQSFFLKGLVNGNVTFKNSMRLNGNNNQFFKNANSSNTQILEKHRIWLDVVSIDGVYKQTLIGYVTNGTLGFDRGLDGAYLGAINSTSIYSLADNGSKLSIQGKSLPFYDSDHVNLGFSCDAPGSYTISLYSLDGLFQSQDIFLKDNLLNQVHNLKLSPYVFASNAGVFENRFAIVYNISNLDVESHYFDDSDVVLYKQNNKIYVNSGLIEMKKILVYDARGRKLNEKEVFNTNETYFEFGDVNQILFFKIITNKDKIISKKYVN